MGKTLRYKTGNREGEWEIRKYAGNGYYECVCSCGAVKLVRGDSLSSGNSKSCGHQVQAQKDSWIGKRFGEWEVLEYRRTGVLLCRCSCGAIKEQYISALTRGLTKSCGHSEFIGLRFGKLVVLERLDNSYQIYCASKHLCKCDCGNIVEVYTSNLKAGYVTSCGCSNKCSKYETDINELFPGGIRNKPILYTNDGRNLEIDLYFEAKKIGIEFNGDFWHSEENKARHYHWDKTQRAIEQGINLIHIFEYEWIGNKDRIIQYINKVLYNNKDKVIGARICSIAEVTDIEAKLFETKYHLQGSINAGVRIGLYYDNKLVALMSFGASRYDKSYEVELLRLTFGDYTIHGAAEKMLKYYISNYNPHSIVTYCDRSKFNGGIYRKLGFKFICHTEPNYKWVKHSTENGNTVVEVLNREACQKHKLLERGYGNLGNTETEIMRALKYHKIYDCGNDKYGLVLSNNYGGQYNG